VQFDTLRRAQRAFHGTGTRGLPDLEPIQPRGVVADDLSPLLVRHAIEDALEDLPGLRNGGLGVRVVRAPT